MNLHTHIVAHDSTGDQERYRTKDIVFKESDPPFELWPDADACIVDLYEYRDDYYHKLGRKYSRIAIFDDCMFQVPEQVSAVINPNVYADTSMYPPSVAVFAGPQYYLLRSEFTKIPPSTYSGTHVLICMGGSDPEEQTGRLLAIVRRITDRPIDVVFGVHNLDQPSMDDYSRIPGVKVHTAVCLMRPLMERAAYAVVGAGTLLYELAYMGIPAACLCLAENQRMNAEAFAMHMAALFIGHHNQVSDEAIAVTLARLEHEASLRSVMRSNAQKLVDAQGAERLAKGLAAWIVST